MRCSRCTRARTSARSSARHRDTVLTRHPRRRRRKKKEAKAPKADPKKDTITIEDYLKKLPARGLASSDVFKGKRTQKAWDIELIKLSGKLSASA